MFNRFLLLFSLFCSTLIHPFVSYCLMERNGKLILILGDMHHNQINELNEEHFNALKDMVSRVAGINKINCFIEMDTEDFRWYIGSKKASIEQAPFEQFKGGITLDKFADEFGNPKFLNIVPADRRSQKSRDIFRIFKINEVLLFKNINKLEQLEKEKFNFNKFKQLSETNVQTDLTIGIYLGYLDEAINSATCLVEEYKNSEFYNILNEQLQQIKKFAEEIGLLFKVYNRSTLVNAFIIDRFKDCNTLRDVQLIFNQTKKLLPNPHSIFADLGFFDFVIKDQAKSDKSVICVGSAHAKNLKALFEKIGYNTVACESCYVSLDDGSGYFHSVDQFKSTLLSVVKQFLQTVKSYKCEFCNKPNALKRCLVCNEVRYCSTQCQKDHWNLHKTLCACLAGKKQLYLVAPIQFK